MRFTERNKTLGNNAFVSTTFVAHELDTYWNAYVYMLEQNNKDQEFYRLQKEIYDRIFYFIMTIETTMDMYNECDMTCAKFKKGYSYIPAIPPGSFDSSFKNTKNTLRGESSFKEGLHFNLYNYTDTVERWYERITVSIVSKL